MKTYCPHCGRETSTSARDRKADAESACWNDSLNFDGVRECGIFTAGRRAAFKEAIAIVKTALGPADPILWALRKAMKPARVKA